MKDLCGKYLFLSKSFLCTVEGGGRGWLSWGKTDGEESWGIDFFVVR